MSKAEVAPEGAAAAADPCLALKLGLVEVGGVEILMEHAWILVISDGAIQEVLTESIRTIRICW